MTIHEALDIAVKETGVERYRYLCLEHPSKRIRDDYTRFVFELAVKTLPDQPNPSIATQAGSALAGFGKAALSAMKGNGFTVGKKFTEERLAICGSCEHYDAKHRRCNICKCFLVVKAAIAENHCPVGKW